MCYSTSTLSYSKRDRILSSSIGLAHGLQFSVVCEPDALACSLISSLGRETHEMIQQNLDEVCDNLQQQDALYHTVMHTSISDMIER